RSDFLLGLIGPPRLGYDGPHYLGNFDSGQATGLYFTPMAFLDDEVVELWLKVDSAEPDPRYHNVLVGFIGPLAPNVPSNGPESQSLQAIGGESAAKYWFNFYRSHGIPGAIYRTLY